VQNIDAWVIGTRNYSCIVRNKEDLEFLNDKKQEFIKNRDTGLILNAIALSWFEILENLKQKNLIKELKSDITKFSYTLIGDFVGLKLMKFSKRTIIFHSIVENYSTDNSLPISESYLFFEKYGFYVSPFEKLSKNIESFVSFAKMLKELYLDISISHVAHEEEGSVFSIVERSKTGKCTVISMFKMYSNEMIYFKKIYENLFVLTEQLTSKFVQKSQGS
jgi:hypothetical protein